MGFKGLARATISLAMLAALRFFAAGAPQLSARISPELWIPAGNYAQSDPSLELFSVGYGATLAGDMSLLGFLSPYAEISAASVPYNNSSYSLTFWQLGGGLSCFVYPMPRLMARAGFGGGISHVSAPKTDLAEAIKGLAPYWKAKAEFGYRFSPTFSLLAECGYTTIIGSESSVYRGLSTGVLANIALDRLGGGTSGLAMSVSRQSPLFPITYYKSEKVPIGYLKLTNGESAEIRNVSVRFSAGAYTSRAADCGSFPLVRRGASVEMPLYANFNDKVLGFSELTKVQGEIRVDYRILDSSRESQSAVTLSFNNRNASTWRDARVVGAFISPQDPSMLEISKYVAGLVRVHSRPELDKNIQYGMGLYEGFRVYGVTWSADPTLPYAAARQDPASIAYIQYPYQTLSYKSGDSDSLAILVAEALESVAIPAAIVPLPEQVLVAFPLDMPASRARSTFSNPDDLIYRGDRAWVPLAVSLMRDGFLRSWKGGAELWRAHSGDNPQFVEVEDAWKEFLPLSLADVDFRPIRPSETAINAAFDNVVSRFVTAEVGPKAKRIAEGIQGAGTGRQWNSLGILYAQYGLYEEANANFGKAVAMDYGPAVVNYANVCFLLKDYASASTYFRRALDSQPENKTALLGLARSRYELDDYSGADALFAKLKAVDPALADQYAYLQSKVDTGGALGADAADRLKGGPWDGGN